MDILLVGLNARYIHSALGLRYLRANLAELRERSQIIEFTLDRPTAEMAEQLLALRPRIIGLGIYIWNLEPMTRLARLLKRVAPDVSLVLGGPEVSHEWQQQPLVAEADYLITGQADLAFAQLCRQLLRGEAPEQRLIQASLPPLAQLQLPYAEYSATDLAQRLLYVEASRGCPFRCAFCLSALDKTAWAFPLPRLLQALEGLYERGARQFKFVDRTFNLKPEHSCAILDFFLQRLQPGLFLHFEVIPDHLPEGLKQRLSRFPAGSLQLEIGIQSLDAQVQQRIDRKQDLARSLSNLRWLRQHTQAHLHLDLIIGLPGEGMAGFARGFEQLLALQPQEIQLGLLKRLRGSPLTGLSEEFAMVYSPDPPYEILSTSALDFAQVQRLKRFARYWDLLGNSGRFQHSLPWLLAERPFARFLAFSDWLYAETGQTSQLALKRLFELLWRYLQREGQSEGIEQAVCSASLRQALLTDYSASGSKGRLSLVQGNEAQEQEPAAAHPVADGRANRRQLRHPGCLGKAAFTVKR
jgi:radical SAM superfamily enzyme YgiQ (UPF0313 family)